MEERIAKWMEIPAYPVAVLSKKRKRLYRNRLAKLLLPKESFLRERLQSLCLQKGEFLKELCLDGISYLVVILSVSEDETLFCFFEHFLPLQEAFSRAIIQKMQDFFWNLLDKEKEPDSQKLIRLDQIAARACALRTQGEDYLRLLDAPQLILGDEEKTCSLKGFFAYLKRALDARGVGATFRFPEDSTVSSSGTVLSFLVLNLVHFVRLFKGERQVELSVCEETEHLRFYVDFADDGAVESSLEDMLCRGKENAKMLHILPLFCILRVCMEKGIPWSVKKSDGTLTFSFYLPKGDALPVLFLSDATSKEIAELLRMVKILFS